MRKAALAFAAALAGACASPGAQPPAAPAASAPAAKAIALRNAGFEAPMPAGARCPPGWGCTMHNNPEAFRFTLDERAPAEGRRSLCIERVADEPWALATQAVAPAGVRGARVRLSMAVRGDALSGPGAGPWILVAGRPRAHASRLVQAGAAWQRVSVELLVPAGAQVVEAGATLEGAGRACVDDVTLEIIAAPPGAQGQP